MNDDTNNRRLAIAALICGVLSFFLMPGLFGGLAIAFGIIVRDKSENGTRIRQNANFGILFGSLGILLWIFSIIALNQLGIDMNQLVQGATGESTSAF
jgi:hypothetical protein